MREFWVRIRRGSGRSRARCCCSVGEVWAGSRLPLDSNCGGPWGEGCRCGGHDVSCEQIAACTGANAYKCRAGPCVKPEGSVDIW
eukprot:1143601-Pelagomonas_calceolata.AAC.1